MTEGEAKAIIGNIWYYTSSFLHDLESSDHDFRKEDYKFFIKFSTGLKLELQITDTQFLLDVKKGTKFIWKSFHHKDPFLAIKIITQLIQAEKMALEVFNSN